MADPRPFALKRLDGWIATVGGIGLLPRAPGTWGSAAAAIAGWFVLAATGSSAVLLIAAVVVFFIGWWASERFSLATDSDDAGCIVIDEVVGQWIAMAAVPATVPWVILSFVLFRLFDIFKPWPIRGVERSSKGGFGVMIDDVLAGLLAGAVGAGFVWLAGAYA